MTVHPVVSSTLAAACLLVSGSATIHGDDLGSIVNRQLAAARAATAQYHDSNEALADGYLDLGPNPVEGGGRPGARSTRGWRRRPGCS